MNVRHAQITLVALFMISLLLHLGCFGYSYISDAIYADDLQTLAVRILAVYSVPLGIMVGGIFGGSAKPADKAAGSTLWTAVALSLLWNVLLVFRSISFALSEQDSIASLLDYVDAVAGVATFLIGGALTYFFAKESSSGSSGT
jgi:hypothetical protein